ncbi:MAG: DUF72 domain-containing protein [Myxococcales bacterium]|nr:DUF72 domain-containing protein [Myxococcales bacterium]
MKLRAGTSGFSYAEWRGAFYPEGLPADAMLAHYASRLGSVEINNTFYRMPSPAVLAGWAGATPPEFRFAVKASRRITHLSKLRNVADPVAFLAKTLGGLGDKLGVVLYQLPPVLRRDDALLRDFLALLPSEQRAALEVRHASWLDDAVYSLLRDKNVALVAGDPEEGGPVVPLEPTADFGYLRLRAEDYSDADLGAWHARLAAQPWREVFAFFKHETKGPDFALRLSALAEGPRRPGVAKPRASAARGSGRKRTA